MKLSRGLAFKQQCDPFDLNSAEEESDDDECIKKFEKLYNTSGKAGPEIDERLTKSRSYSNYPKVSLGCKTVDNPGLRSSIPSTRSRDFHRSRGRGTIKINNSRGGDFQA
ncbi:hypothetical protein PoB_005040800 [Plakobranchus ocellatus]|uniref:Uncharacterized protein n=1 Tax=Plakobranchus ocellatus TaxID=259542 RepID=A0AAV4BWB4_9GAST|nr:hypothetical protein PoB_005040800 [Plakobranchus ocellatus]